MRLFFGLPLGHSARRTVAEHIDLLKTIPAIGKVSWVQPRNLHVTLQFLGNLPDDLQDKIDGWQTDLMIHPISTIIGPIDAFPNLSNPKVLFLRIEPQEPFRILFHELESRLDRIGIPREPRPYIPHLTIARVRKAGQFWRDRPDQRLRRPRCRRLRSRPDRVSVLQPIQIQDVLKTVALFDSRLTPSGPVYTPLAIANLLPPPSPL